MTSTPDSGAAARSLAPHEAIRVLAKLYAQINRVEKDSVHERLANRLFGDLGEWVRNGKAPNQQTRYRLKELVAIVDTKNDKGVMNNVAQTLRRFSAGVVQFGDALRISHRRSERHED